MKKSRAVGFAAVVAGIAAANAFAAWTYDSSALTLSDDSGTVLAVSVVTKYAVTGLQVNSVTSLGTNTDVDFTGFSTPGEGYRVISFNASAMKDKSITSIVAPDAISCGTSSFQSCASLTNAVFSTSLRDIGVNSFLNCYHLDDFYPQTVSNVTSLGGRAFENASLKNVSFHFPAVTTCGAQAFYFNNPKKLTDFGPVEIVMTNVVTLGNIAMRSRSNTEIDGRMPNLVITSNVAGGQFNGTKIREAYMPKVTHVTTEMFRNCTHLTNAVFSSDLEFLGQYAFLGCSSLKDVSHLLTPKIKTICQGAIYSCGITDVVFNCPQIDSMTNQLFYTCTSLTNVVIRSPVREVCSASLFGMKDGATIWFENGAPSVVATNSLCKQGSDSAAARYRVYIHDKDLPSSAWATTIEECTAADKRRTDYPGKRTIGKVHASYVYNANTGVVRSSYYYLVRYPLGGILIVR